MSRPSRRESVVLQTPVPQPSGVPASRKPGRVITVLTNHVAIKQLPQAIYHIYTGVLYRSNKGDWREEKRSEKRIRVIDRLQSVVAPHMFVNCVFDGMNLLFVPYVLAFPGGGPNATFSVHMGNSPTPSVNATYKVIIAKTAHPGIRTTDVEDLIKKHRGAPSAQALQVITLLQLIIRQHSNNIMKPAVNAKAYFTNQDKQVVEGTQIELWRGYFQSVRPTINRLLINIDTTVAPFIAPCGVIDFMLDALGSRNVAHLAIPISHPNFHKLERALKNHQIVVRFNNASTKVIRGLEERAGHFTFFNDQKGRSMSVKSHYHRAHGYKMAYPDIVGLRLTGPNAPNPVIVPAELCTFKSSQFYKRRLDENMTAQMVKFATLRPRERRKNIERGFNTNVASPVQHYQQSSYIKAAGMVVGEKLESVQGRMLPPPTLFYDQPTLYAAKPQKRPSEVPRGGAWNMVGKKLAKLRDLRNWAVVNFAPDKISDRDAKRFVERLIVGCQNLGMNVEPPASRPLNGNGLAVEACLDEAYNRLDPSKAPLLLIFLPQNAKGIRQRVKHYGDVVRDAITQCVREGKVRSANDQYFNNVGIKINARLGGISTEVRSHVMDLVQSKTTMIVGADVSHPGPGQMRPSMISLVYSHNRDATRYNAITDIQDARIERIENMKEYAYRAIKGFVKINNRENSEIRLFPQRVVFYRDGISEGEFHRVAPQEVADFKAGVEKALNEYKSARRAPPNAPGPEIVYVVVGKRHHVVFFPDDQDADKTGNLPSGFVTDKGLESPFAHDFFLQSHSAIQGTSRSSHYVILHNEIREFDVEVIKQLSFHLCHTYAKATRAVSIPAPVYYADLACGRGAFHVNTNMDFDSDSGSNSIDMALWRSAFLPPKRNIGQTMYFL